MLEINEHLGENSTSGSLILHGKLFMYMCIFYFLGCNETLTSVNGIFRSPNYPRNYPHGQYCSWKIKVNTTLRIRLMFTDFSLQIEKNTDQLYVYDGENATGKILDVFYGSSSSKGRNLLFFQQLIRDLQVGQERLLCRLQCLLWHCWWSGWVIFTLKFNTHALQL